MTTLVLMFKRLGKKDEKSMAIFIEAPTEK